MKIVVTGSAGFVGSHICDALLHAGHAVVGIDNNASGVDFTPSGVERRALDLAANLHERDFDGADAVVHAAAYPELRHNWDSRGERDRLYRNNLEATVNVLEKMPEKARLIFLSSASVYGSARHDGAVEETDAQPGTQESPYAATKFAGEALCAAYSYKAVRSWYALRLVNVVGARSHRGVVADFARMMRESGKIHAADTGEQRKSWVHVLDVAGAVAALVSASAPSGVYNVTSEERVSWWDIVRAMGVPPDRVTYERCRAGAVGDPWNLHVSGAKLAPVYRCDRAVSSGILDALAGHND